MVKKLLTLLLSLTILSNCNAQQNGSAASAEETYTFKTPSRDGAGKYYMGREISQVMGHLAAGWLERPEREQEENVSRA